MAGPREGPVLEGHRLSFNEWKNHLALVALAPKRRKTVTSTVPTGQTTTA